jgi:hypothetical protein
MGHAEPTGEMRNAHKILIEKPEAKTPFEEADIDGRVILVRGVGSVKWIHVAQHGDQWWALVNTKI